MFSGPRGKLVLTATDLKIKEIIPPIDVNIDLIELEEDIVCYLLGYQKYLYIMRSPGMSNLDSFQIP